MTSKLSHQGLPFPPRAETSKRKHDDGLLEGSDSGLSESQKRRVRKPRTREEPFTDIEGLDNSKDSDYEPDLVALDRGDIERQLQSGASVFVLESTKSWKSHCRAQFCILRELRGRPNIESDYRLNLKDLTGGRSGPVSYYKQPDRFYHISCVEQILDLRTLLESKQLQHDGGFKLQSNLFGVIPYHTPVHIAIDDWFENAGSSFDFEEYKDYEKAYKDWKSVALIQMEVSSRVARDGETESSWGSEPERPTYSTKERTPRLLSEVLASIEEVEQIDGIPKTWLEFLSQSEDDTEDEEDSEGVTKGKTPLDAEETQATRKATDLEMKERRKELVDQINELKETIKKSKMKDKDQAEVKENEVDPSAHHVAKTDAAGASVVESTIAEKDISQTVAEGGGPGPQEG